MKILIVEDSAAFRGTLRGIIESRFPVVQVREAWLPEQAMEVVRSFGPQLVFMDVRLRDKSGFELAAKIKQEFPRTSIVILTSHDLPEYRHAALRARASCFLCKSEVGPKEIEDVVLSLFNSNLGPEK